MSAIVLPWLGHGIHLVCEKTMRSVVTAVHQVISASRSCGGDIAIVSHGGVGTLLLCHLRGDQISRDHDQPRNNGNYFVLDGASQRLRHGWAPFDT